MKTDKKIKEKIISHSIVETSRVFKRLAALMIFASFFALSLIVLFRVGDISLELPVIKKYLWLVEILLSLWIASRLAIKNIKKAYFSMYVSYTLGAALIAYSSVMVYYTIDYQPTEWLDLRKLFVWFTPIIGINILWKILFVALEYKVRPFFAQKMMWVAIQDMIMISMFWVAAEIFDMYVVQDVAFNMKNDTQMFLIFFEIIALFAVLVIHYITFTRYWKYSEYGRSATRKAMLWHSLMKLGSITIWFVVRDVYMHMNTQWIIMTCASAVLFITLAIFGLSRKHSGGGSKIYTFMAASFITLIGVGMFVMETWWHTNSLDILPVVLITYTAIYTLDIIIEPSTTWWIARSFANVVSAVAAYVLVDWLFGNYFGNDMLKLPFSLNEIIAIPFLLGIASLEMSSIVSAWVKYNTILRSAQKVIKIQEDKGVSHE